MRHIGTLLVLASGLASAQEPPRVFVTGVEGPIARQAIVRTLIAAELYECQHTHMGRPVRFTLTIDADGSAQVSRRVLAHEEVRSYVPCVRRFVSRLRFAPRSAPTCARITIAFQPSGLGVRR